MKKTQNKKPETQDIINNIKLIKFIRDIKIIYDKKYFYNSNKVQYDRICKNKEYINLLSLIINQHLLYSLKYNYFSKLSIKSIKNINLNLYENICKYKNIIIVNQPMFIIAENVDNLVTTKNISVDNYKIKSELDVIDIIKNNQTKLIYLFLIDNYVLRCKIVNNNKYLSFIRKEKLEKLK